MANPNKSLPTDNSAPGAVPDSAGSTSGWTPKKFASPGIDSSPDEQGVFNSGAGMGPNVKTAKSGANPYDWNGRNPYSALQSGRLIGNFPATQAPPASSLRIRRRGISPFGGAADRFKSGAIREKAGGIVDMNPGAGSLIAGGPGAAASMVRVNGARKVNEGMKLPVLPMAVTRGGTAVMPAGGGVLGFGPAAPLVPKLPMPSVIKVLTNPASVS